MAHRDFNTLFDEFLQKLKKAIPTASDLWSYHDMFISSKKVNPQAPVNVFLNTTHPFAKSIFAKDDTYFINHEKVSGTGIALWADYWEDLSDKSKNALWIYLQNLLILCYAWIGIDTLNEDILKKIIGESSNYIPKTMDTLEDFPDLKPVLHKKYC